MTHDGGWIRLWNDEQPNPVVIGNEVITFLENEQADSIGRQLRRWEGGGGAGRPTTSSPARALVCRAAPSARPRRSSGVRSSSSTGFAGTLVKMVEHVLDHVRRFVLHPKAGRDLPMTEAVRRSR